jgi:Ca2+-binding EF-hand superfamily protein
MDTIKYVFNSLAGDRFDAANENKQGLLRPQREQGSVIAVRNAGRRNSAMTEDKLKKIVKQMTGPSHRGFADKYGTLKKDDLVNLFGSYGLPAEQASAFFHSADVDRRGEIDFSYFRDNIGRFLKVEQSERSPGREKKRRAPLDQATMVKISDHIGGKACSKYNTIAQAFRCIDRDLDNQVDRYEVRSLFRYYGSSTKMADRFFDTLDKGGEGKIDFNDFKEMFAPYIQPGYHAPVAGENQKDAYLQKNWGHSQYAQNIMSPSRGSRSNRSNPSSQGETELHKNSFGRFEGMSTYQASYNADVYGQVR